MPVAYVDVLAFILLFPPCAYFFEVVGLRPAQWRRKARVYWYGRDGYGALSLDDADDADEGGQALRMRRLGGGEEDDDEEDDDEQGERGGMLGGPARTAAEEKARAAAAKRRAKNKEKQRKRHDRRAKSTAIWMGAMVDYTADKTSQQRAAVELLDAYNPGSTERYEAALAEGEAEAQSSSEDEDEDGAEPEPEPEEGSIGWLLAQHRLEQWAPKLAGIGVEEVDDLTLVELDDLKALGMNKLERVRFQKCVERELGGGDCSENTDGGTAGGSNGRRVTFETEGDDQGSRPIGTRISSTNAVSFFGLFNRKKVCTFPLVNDEFFKIENVGHSHLKGAAEAKKWDDAVRKL